VTWLNHIRFKKGLRKEIVDKMTHGSFKSAIPDSLKSERLRYSFNYKFVLLHSIPESKLQIKHEFGEHEAVQANWKSKDAAHSTPPQL